MEIEVGEWHSSAQKGLVELTRLLEEEEIRSGKMKNNNFIVKKDAVVLIMRLLDAESRITSRSSPPDQTLYRMKRSQILESQRLHSLERKTKGVKFISPKACWSFLHNPDFGKQGRIFRGLQGEGFDRRVQLPLRPEVLNI
jgi:hypothetical protein